MDKEILLEAINENILDDEYDDIEYAQGAFLYTAVTIIDQIQTYFLDNINSILKKERQISKNDVFLFLKVKNILKNDYSNLYENINSELGEADYGCYFFEDKTQFNKFQEQIEELYEEFKNLE